MSTDFVTSSNKRASVVRAFDLRLERVLVFFFLYDAFSTMLVSISTEARHKTGHSKFGMLTFYAQQFGFSRYVGRDDRIVGRFVYFREFFASEEVGITNFVHAMFGFADFAFTGDFYGIRHSDAGFQIERRTFEARSFARAAGFARRIQDDSYCIRFRPTAFSLFCRVVDASVIDTDDWDFFFFVTLDGCRSNLKFADTIKRCRNTTSLLINMFQVCIGICNRFGDFIRFDDVRLFRSISYFYGVVLFLFVRRFYDFDVFLTCFYRISSSLYNLTNCPFRKREAVRLISSFSARTTDYAFGRLRDDFGIIDIRIQRLDHYSFTSFITTRFDCFFLIQFTQDFIRAYYFLRRGNDQQYFHGRDRKAIFVSYSFSESSRTDLFDYAFIGFLSRDRSISADLTWYETGQEHQDYFADFALRFCRSYCFFYRNRLRLLALRSIIGQVLQFSRSQRITTFEDVCSEPFSV